MKAEDYTIVVLKYIDLYKTTNIIDEQNVSELTQYMDCSEPCRFVSSNLPSKSPETSIQQKKISNPSFESWIEKSPKELVPESFSYHSVPEQHGTVYIEKCITPDGVKDGKYSVVLKPPSAAINYIRQGILKIDDIKDRRVKFSAWIKSANRTPNAVQIDFQDVVKSVAVSSYRNSGEWELVEVESHVSSNANKVLLTLSINSYATAPAYYDNISVEVLPVIEDKGFQN